MIRVVAFRKAILAGVAGALAWEIVVRLLRMAGLPFHDMTYMLGTLFLPGGSVSEWWLAGMALHAGVGAIWAVFYAYFFWSTFDWPPAVQGLVFSFAPALLAIVVMHPQLELMHPLVLNGQMVSSGFFGLRHGWGEPVGEFLGHAIYGVVMGALYTRPVGSPVRRLAHG